MKIFRSESDSASSPSPESTAASKASISDWSSTSVILFCDSRNKKVRIKRFTGTHYRV